MRTELDCISCLVRQSIEAVRNTELETPSRERFVRDVLCVTADWDLEQPAPVLAQAIHRRLRTWTNGHDPYRAAKRHFNRLAMKALPDLAALVRLAPDPMRAAALCAVAANAIDLGVAASLSDEELVEALRAAPNQPLHGDWEGFRRRVSAANDILYLADNAGEIAIDRLLIEKLGPRRITVVVRGRPVLNDATLADAEETRLHEVAEVMDNGSDAPGTLLADCSAAFVERFERADLVIAKGQGNFETLDGSEREVVFLFKVKCPVVSRSVGLDLGSYVLIQN